MIRSIHKINAEGKAVGRVASEIAILLRGKHKVDFVAHHDCGDTVEVSNWDKVKFSGAKMTQKKYYHYSGYPGGLKSANAMKKLKENPRFLLWNAVYHMLPANRLRSGMIKRFKFVD